MKSRQYNAGRFPAPAICTRAHQMPQFKQLRSTISPARTSPRTSLRSRALGAGSFTTPPNSTNPTSVRRYDVTCVQQP
jgi:hypothetical protein